MTDDMPQPRTPSAPMSEYGGHLAAVAQAPSVEQLLDAVRHAVLCAEVHGDRVSPWWRGVVEAYRELVPDPHGEIAARIAAHDLPPVADRCGATP